MHAYRREPRNQELFEEIDGRYRDANAESIRVQSVYGPGTALLGEIGTFLVLLYGGIARRRRQRSSSACW